MTTMMAGSEYSLPKYMKYKRRYYDMDNYTTKSNVRSGSTEVSDVNKTQTAINNKLSNSCTRSNNQQTMELSPRYSDQPQGPPKKRHIACGDLSPDTTTSSDEQHTTTDSFLLNLENQQTTQEICVALLSMAFWRPESGQNGEDCHTDPRSVDAGVKHQTEVGELTNCAEVNNTAGNHPNTTKIKESTPGALYSQDNITQEVVVRGIRDSCCARAETQTDKGTGETRISPSAVDPVHTSVFNPKMDNSDVLTEEQHEELRFPDDPGLCLGNITDCANRNSRLVDCNRVCLNRSFVHSVNDRVQTSDISMNPTTVAFQNKQTGAGDDPRVLPYTKSSCGPSHPTTVMAETPPGPSNAHNDSGPYNPNTELASPHLFADSKQIADSPTSPEVSKVLSLFPKPARGRQLWEIVEIMARRHKDDYFIGWTADEIMDLTPDQRPNVFPVTSKLKKEYVSKSVMTENKKLAFSYYSNEDWGREFRDKLRNGSFKTLSDAKHQASILWRIHCPEYDETRAVRMRDSSGKIIMKRTREKTGSEFEYRQQLRKAKMNTIVDQIWSKRAIIADLLSSENHLPSIILEIKGERADYTPSGDKATQLADVIAHKLIKELLSVNNDRLL